MHPVVKTLTVLGFVLGGVGAVVIWVTGNFPLGGAVFAIGFIFAAAGIVSGILILSSDNISGINPFGIKLAAIGFGLAALPIAIGVFLLGADESVMGIFFKIGAGLIVVGLIIHFLYLIRSRNGT